MTLLAESTEGMHNLFRLSSLASLEGYYYKPRMDRELLETYGRGIIATTGCPSGEVQRLLQQDRYADACQAASDYRDIFGRDNFFCELMDHGISIEKQVQEDLFRLKKELGLPGLATNDLHYTYADDAKPHEVLLCVQTGKTLADPNRFKFDAQDFYLKSPAEMRAQWDPQFPEACDNTLLIAERVDVGFTEGQDLMPRAPVPEGETEESWLVKEVEQGLHQRFPNGVTDQYRKQAEYELGVIIQMGFPGYFLVVADLIQHAKSVGIRCGPGRGSAAGSLVAYVLGITDLDPIKHKLIFERFLNPERISMPDIDMDFDERRRGEMIRYTTEKYGEDRIAQIITYSTIKAKAAIKDSARVLFGQPGYAVADRITKAMPPAIMGKDIPLSRASSTPRTSATRRPPRSARSTRSDPQVKEIIDTARGLEGLKRQWGVHAAGVIMSSTPLIDVIPIQRRDSDGAIITQFDMGACETLGLLKMDFLGLRNLTIIDDALENIELNGKPKLVIEDVELDDPKTYELLAKGETLGVFQLDGGPMRDLLRRMAPTEFDDISAVGALYRPGPMGANAHNDYADRKNKRQEVTPIHPELAEPLKDILGETYGLIVYQEQVMAIAQKLAGYTLGKADLLRRAMGKKKKEILDKEYAGFAQGMKDHGYSEAAVKTLWDILLPFSDYAFNRAHSAAYGVVSYWTAFLKANYPAEYMAAVLTSVRDDKDKAAVYLGGMPADGHPGAAAGRQRLGAQLRAGRRGHPLRSGRDPQRRRERRRRDRGGAQGEGRVHRLLGLPAQGRRGGLQQEGHRVADQGRGVRLAGALPQGPAARARRRDRRGDEHEEGGVDGAVRPLRLDGRVGVVGAGRRVRREGAHRGMGPQAPAGRRTGDARALRLGPSAGRDRAGAGGQGGHPDLGDPGGRRRRGRADHRRRHPGRGEPPGEQER